VFNNPRKDFGSVTILWSQPVSALQIQSPDGKWRWVKHLDNALVSFNKVLSKSNIKLTFHLPWRLLMRVIALNSFLVGFTKPQFIELSSRHQTNNTFNVWDFSISVYPMKT
jgi:hypothetical protein